MFKRCMFAAASVVVVSAMQGQQIELLQLQAATVGEIEDTVPTTENGYRIVAALQDNEKMKTFIHRVVQAEARYIKDVSELNGMVPFYSGVQGVQNLEALKRELRSAAWVADGEGRNAPLNEVGYQKVASLKSKPHMVAFARRILDAAAKKPDDEGALLGLIPYYDGEVAVQSFDALSNELLSAPWASSRMTSPAPAALVKVGKEDPDEEPVETTLATTTLATTLATTTAATTTLATTTLATTTLATTTLATTTLATTTLATTTLAEEEPEEEALRAHGKSSTFMRIKTLFGR